MSASSVQTETEVTPRNRARLYFDVGRSRFFSEFDTVTDFSWFGSKRAARLWCAAEDVEFIDNSISRLPECLHRLVLAARKAGSGYLCHRYSYESSRVRRTHNYE